MSGLPDPRPSADDDRVDVLVLGGGPAGCATALCLARQGHRVAVVERTRYEAPRVGETLSPG
ncbi:MAG TPA: FAD-dependent oxidoreductase, partial [Burkholderiaceae bacterium]